MNLYNLNTTILELRESAEISVRSYHVCSKIGINTIQDLHNYLNKNVDFLSVKNCGNKSNKELLEVYKQYYSPFSNTPNTNNEINEIQNSLKFEKIVEIEFEKLSVRAKNALLKMFNKKTKWSFIIREEFINKTFEIDKLKNVGAKTTFEIELFVNKIQDLYFSKANEELSPYELINHEINKITGFNVTEHYLLEKYKQKEFPIIIFTASYLKELFKLDDIETIAIKSFFKLSKEILTSKEIARKFEITEERVRQKRKIAHEKILKYSEVFNGLLINSNYLNLIGSSDIYFMQDIFNEKSISIEIEETGELFATFILGLIFSNEYYSLTKNDKLSRSLEVILIEKYNRHKTINGNYLIRNNIITKPQIIKLLEKVINIICSRQAKDCELDLKDLIKFDFSENTYKAIQIIFWNEFNIDLVDGKIIIKRNTLKLVYEYAFEALLKIGKPAHVSDIIIEIQKTFPDFDSNENSLKSAIRRYKSLFIYFGRTSTFGLKKWELSSKNIKGGTIRDIVEEFLEDCDEPCHINSITQYVNKYRKTDSTSIIQNLKLTTNKRFVFFKGSYIGLVSKNYDNNTTKKYNIEVLSIDDLLSSIFSK